MTAGILPSRIAFEGWRSKFVSWAGGYLRVIPINDGADAPCPFPPWQAAQPLDTKMARPAGIAVLVAAAPGFTGAAFEAVAELVLVAGGVAVEGVDAGAASFCPAAFCAGTTVLASFFALAEVAGASERR